jgi:hypothetical protein
MESVVGSIKLMLFVYVLAAAVSLATAWLIKLIFFVIRMQKKRAAALQAAQATPAAAPADATAKRMT